MSRENIIPNSQEWNDFLYHNLFFFFFFKSTLAVRHAVPFYSNLEAGGVYGKCIVR